MFPAVPEVVLVQKPFAVAEAEIRQADSIGVCVKNRSALVIHAEVLAVDSETMEVGVAPTESKLNCIVKIGNILVGTKQ